MLYRINENNIMHQNNILCSGALPFILKNFDEQELLIDLEKYEERVEKL